MGSRSATSCAAVARAPLGPLLLALVLLPDCHSPPDPEAIADEVDEMCRKFCPLYLNCLTDPVLKTSKACLEDCVGFAGHQALDGCGTAARGVLRCQSELTCDEFSIGWNAPLDAEGFPCVDERYDWATCDPDDP